MEQITFEQNILRSIESAVSGVMQTNGRIVNLAELSVMNNETGKKMIIKITIVAEPQLFSKTTYCTDEGVSSTELGSIPGVLRTSSVIEQLKQFERDA